MGGQKQANATRKMKKRLRNSPPDVFVIARAAHSGAFGPAKEVAMEGYQFYVGCKSIGALNAATAAIARYEEKLKEAQDDFREAVPGVEVSKEVDTIYKALTWGPLGQSYNKMFAAWLETGEDSFLPIERLAEHVGVSVGQIQARFSKISARIRRVASDEELEKSPKTPLGLLVDVAYDAGGSPSHRLTKAGRAAVQHYVGG